MLLIPENIVKWSRKRLVLVNGVLVISYWIEMNRMDSFGFIIVYLKMQ